MFSKYLLQEYQKSGLFGKALTLDQAITDFYDPPR